MRKSTFILTLVFGIAAAATAQTGLPEPDQIIEKYVQAMGGKAALEKLTSRYVKGAVEVPTYGSSGTFEEYGKAPGKRLLKSEFEGYGVVIQACDGTAAWAEDPQNGRRDLSGAELASEKRASDFHGPLHMKQHYTKLAVTGKAKVGARDAYVMEASPAEGNPEKRYFDVENGLMLRVEVPGGEGTVTVAFEDYKEVDGVKVAHTMKIEMPQVSLVYKVAEVKHQLPVEDAKFAKPAGK